MITLVSVVVAVVIVSLWSKAVYTKGNKNVYVAFEALTNELDKMAQELGSSSVYVYWEKTKGKDYADRAKENIENTLKFLREG